LGHWDLAPFGISSPGSGANTGRGAAVLLGVLLTRLWCPSVSHRVSHHCTPLGAQDALSGMVGEMEYAPD
jgi:hypothetical protein